MEECRLGPHGDAGAAGPRRGHVTACHLGLCVCVKGLAVELGTNPAASPEPGSVRPGQEAVTAARVTGQPGRACVEG